MGSISQRIVDSPHEIRIAAQWEGTGKQRWTKFHYPYPLSSNLLFVLQKHLKNLTATTMASITILIIITFVSFKYLIIRP